MWNPFAAKRAHEELLARLAADQQRYLADTIRAMSEQQAKSLEKVGEMVQTIAQSQQKTSEVLQTWLDGFKVTELPTSSTVTEEDEVRMTVERALTAPDSILPPMPEGLPAEFQLAWQLKQGLME